MIYSLLISYLVVSILMLLLWYRQTRTHRAGIVDVAWAMCTGAIALISLYFADGNWTRRVILMIMISIWSLRLAIHLFERLKREGEDGRYLMLREQWGDKTQVKMFWFFQAQSFWALLFAMPILGAGMNQIAFYTAFDIAGLIVYLIAVTGEGLADYQLTRFRIQNPDGTQVCNSGLWRYSRHPNYFFEWLNWCAYALLAIGGSWWCVSILGPIMMYFFITRVTGIPPTEKRALQTKGDAYRDYQNSTNAFFPGPIKNNKVN